MFNTNRWWECREIGWLNWMTCWWDYKWYGHPGKHFFSFWKTEHVFTIQFSNCISGHLSHRNLYTNVYSNFIYKDQKLESAQMSFNWLVTLWYIHHGILLTNKKAQTIDTGNNGMNLQRIILLKKFQSPKVINCFYLYYNPETTWL